MPYVTVSLYRESYKTFMFFHVQACTSITTLISFPRIRFCWYSAFCPVSYTVTATMKTPRKWVTTYQHVLTLTQRQIERESSFVYKTVTIATTSLCSFLFVDANIYDSSKSHPNKHYVLRYSCWWCYFYVKKIL